MLVNEGVTSKVWRLNTINRDRGAGGGGHVPPNIFRIVKS